MNLIQKVYLYMGLKYITLHRKLNLVPSPFKYHILILKVQIYINR